MGIDQWNRKSVRYKISGELGEPRTLSEIR